MSKDEAIGKIENIIEKHLQCEEQQDVAKETCLTHRNWCANDIYDAGFRDITDLKCWLEVWINPNIPLEGNVIKIQDVLDKLESL